MVSIGQVAVLLVQFKRKLPIILSFSMKFIDYCGEIDDNVIFRVIHAVLNSVFEICESM